MDRAPELADRLAHSVAFETHHFSLRTSVAAMCAKCGVTVLSDAAVMTCRPLDDVAQARLVAKWTGHALKP